MPKGLASYTESGSQIDLSDANTLVLDEGGRSQQKTINGTSSQSSAITSDSVDVHVTVDCFVRRGSNPTAVSDGTDRFIPGGNTVRLAGIAPGEKIAFKTTGLTGVAYISPST